MPERKQAKSFRPGVSRPSLGAAVELTGGGVAGEEASHTLAPQQHNPHSRFFTICVIFASPRASVPEIRDLPPLLARYHEHIYADDRWDRRVPDAAAAAHAKMGLDQERGGVVVVRPDGYVGLVAQLVEGSGTVDALNEYFGAFATKKLGEFRASL